MSDLAAQLELSRNLYDELFAQTEQLRTDRQLVVDAMREVVKDEGAQWGWATIEWAKGLLRKLGEQP